MNGKSLTDHLGNGNYLSGHTGSFKTFAKGFENNVFYVGVAKRSQGREYQVVTEVVSTDLTAFGLYSRPRSRFSHTDLLLD